jgi:Mce-associated membrane protein
MAESTTEHERETGQTMPSDDERAVVLEKTDDDVATEPAPEAGAADEADVPGRTRGRRARRAAATRATEQGDEAEAPDEPGGAWASEANESAKATAATRTGSKATKKGTSPAVAEKKPGATKKPGAKTAAAVAAPGRRLIQVSTALLVLAVLLAALLLVQLIKGPGNGGKLVAREDRSQEALQAASSKIPKLYSYDYRQIDANINEQLQLTTGDINNQIKSDTAPALKQLAPKVKAIVQAVSVDAAVVDDSGSDVQVLIFLNQAVNSSLLPAPRLDRNRVVATMRLVDGQWKVAGIKAL